MSAIYDCECDSFEMYEEQDSFEMAEAVPGPGVPSGGLTGQVLKKRSDEDFDTEWADESGGGGGTSDYTQLSNKPQINGNTLTGNKFGADLGLVNAETGKGLSTNDYTTADKNKLSGIEAQANKTVIDSTLTNAGQAADAKATGDAVSELRNTLNHKADAIYDTASGDIASFPDGADGLPVKDLTVGIEPVQNLHGYANPWPAGGGKNLWSAEATFSKDGTTQYIQKDCNLPAGTYTLSGIVTAVSGVSSVRFSFRTATPVVAQLPIESSRSSVEFTLSESCTSVYVYGQSGSSGQNAATYKDIQIESGSIATSYAPYSNICPISGWTGCNISHSGADTSDPTVIPISWQSEAGTVYGGTLDVTSGVLTVTHKGVDMGTLSWSYNSSAAVFYTITDDRKSDVRDNIQSSIYKVVNKRYLDLLDYEMSGSNDTSHVYINVKDTRYNSGSAYATAMSGQTIVYKLAQPIVIQLDPATVTTLLGQNNIWADCGPVSVEYPCDTKLYIDKKLAALVAALS